MSTAKDSWLTIGVSKRILLTKAYDLKMYSIV